MEEIEFWHVCTFCDEVYAVKVVQKDHLSDFVYGVAVRGGGIVTSLGYCPKCLPKVLEENKILATI